MGRTFFSHLQWQWQWPESVYMLILYVLTTFFCTFIRIAFVSNLVFWMLMLKTETLVVVAMELNPLEFLELLPDDGTAHFFLPHLLECSQRNLMTWGLYQTDRPILKDRPTNSSASMAQSQSTNSKHYKPLDNQSIEILWLLCCLRRPHYMVHALSIRFIEPLFNWMWHWYTGFIYNDRLQVVVS